MQPFRTSSCTTACHCKTWVANPVLTRHKLCQGIKQARLGYTQLKARPGKRGGCRQGCQPGTHPTDKCVPENIAQGPWSTGPGCGDHPPPKRVTPSPLLLRRGNVRNHLCRSPQRAAFPAHDTKMHRDAFDLPVFAHMA